eukprot:13817674-Heterocapsa_arctica.AAC.1
MLIGAVPKELDEDAPAPGATRSSKCMGALLCPSCDRWASPASIVMPPGASRSSSRSASSACVPVR